MLASGSGGSLIQAVRTENRFEVGKRQTEMIDLIKSSDATLRAYEYSTLSGV